MAVRTAPRLTRSAGFVAVTAMLVLFMAAAGAPTPLYVVYQQQWGFPTSTLTLIFAVYVLGLLATILVVGALSDHVGRRPVLGAAIALEAVALVLFLTAGGVAPCSLARLAQGVATGAAITTLSAAVVDLTAPDRAGRAGLVTSVATLLGLAGGSSAQARWWSSRPRPRSSSTSCCWSARSPRRSRRLCCPRPRLDARARWPHCGRASGCPATCGRSSCRSRRSCSPAGRSAGCTSRSARPWRRSRSASPTTSSAAWSPRCSAARAPLTALALRNWPLPRVLLLAAALLAVGTVGTLAAIGAGSGPLAAVGTVVAGVGFGAAGLGAFGTMAALARPTERGAVFALTYVVSYLAFSVPAVVAGVAANVVGLGPTATVYGGVVAALGVVAFVARLRLRRQDFRATPA